MVPPLFPFQPGPSIDWRATAHWFHATAPRASLQTTGVLSDSARVKRDAGLNQRSELTVADTKFEPYRDCGHHVWSTRKAAAEPGGVTSSCYRFGRI
jgi:hypothetical protein